MKIEFRDKALAALATKAERLRIPMQVMQEIAEVLAASIDKNFATGGRYGDGPYGGGSTKWTPSGRAKRQGGLTLVDTGRLKNSVEVLITSDSQIVISGGGVVYGPTHNFGDSRGGATFPARPFLVVQEEDITEIQEILLENAEKIFGV